MSTTTDRLPGAARSWATRARGMAIVLLGAVTLLAGCEDAGQGLGPVDPPSVAGSWVGSVSMSGQSFQASFTFTQNGSTVGGTAAIANLLPASPIEAAIDAAGTLVMLIESGCEVWLAQMRVAASEQSMSGPISVDRAGCAQGLDDGGTLSLSRS